MTDHLTTLWRYASVYWGGGKYLNISILHKRNGGVSSARNLGISEAKGEYLMFVDVDDYLLPDTLKKAIDVAESNPDADFCVFGFIRSSRNGSLTQTILSPCKYTKCNRLSYIKSVDTVTLGSMWAKLYKRSFILSNNLFFDERIIASEDNCLNFKILEKVSCFITSDLIIYYYDVNNQNSTSKFIGEKYIDNARIYVNIIYTAINKISRDNNPNNPDIKHKTDIIKSAQITICHNTLYQIYNLYKQKRNKDVKKLFWMKRLVGFMSEIKPDWQNAFTSGFPHIFAITYRIHPRCADLLLRTAFSVNRK